MPHRSYRVICEIAISCVLGQGMIRNIADADRFAGMAISRHGVNEMTKLPDIPREFAGQQEPLRFRREFRFSLASPCIAREVLRQGKDILPSFPQGWDMD